MKNLSVETRQKILEFDALGKSKREICKEFNIDVPMRRPESELFFEVYWISWINSSKENLDFAYPLYWPYVIACTPNLQQPPLPLRVLYLEKWCCVWCGLNYENDTYRISYTSSKSDLLTSLSMIIVGKLTCYFPKVSKNLY